MDESKIVESKLYDLEIDFPQAPNSLHSSTVSKIENAWEQGSILDMNGVIWVRYDKLWIIWRTDKATAKELYFQVSKGKYRREIGGNKYLRGCEVIKFIYERLPATRLKQKDGLKHSKRIFDNIVDDSSVQLIAQNAQLSIEAARKYLKKERIKKFDISCDELTNNLLQKRTAEFSHIVSAKAYPEFADQIWNGLILNKETHEFITKNMVTNGDCLLDLCVDKGWLTDWYEPWNQKFQAI